jgi:hypothetical protein
MVYIQKVEKYAIYIGGNEPNWLLFLHLDWPISAAADVAPDNDCQLDSTNCRIQSL